MTWIYLGGAKDAFLKETPGSKIFGKKAHQQQTDNSCWASCVKHVINYYRSRRGDVERVAEDADIEVGLDITKMSSITAILERCNHENNTDGNRIPTKKEIDDEMSAGQPLIINLGPDPATSDKCNVKATGGHWMVIIGSNVTEGKFLIFDPDDGDMHEYEWNSRKPLSAKYKSWFWQNTSYVTE